MRKIAILTHYHNSVNYGGVLQSYATYKVIKKFNYDAEQLRVHYQIEGGSLVNKQDGIKNIYRFIKIIIKFFLRPIAYKIIPKYRNSKKLRDELNKSFINFRDNLIPHSEREYTIENIKDALDEYDVFIVGSDQVWNPIWYYPPFFLSFAPSDVPKISYAASVSQTELPDSVKAVYKEHLKDFIGVSVREKDAVGLLSDISPVEVVHTLDPTMLLGKDEWDEVASKRLIDEKYVFCYFLGDDRNMRDVAKEFAAKKGLKLANTTHASGLYHQNDLGYGDIKLTSPSPEDFISLIKHAEYVFTDSFHASVFSLIYGREFFVFERAGHRAMGSRIYSLTDLFDVKERFCDNSEKATTGYIESLKPIDYSKDFPKFNEMKERSVEFLKTNLEKAEKMLKNK